MAYRKFTADRIFTGYDMQPPGKGLITDEQGKIIDIVEVGNAEHEFEMHAGILMPGLVNCHCHLELSHLQGQIPKGLGMVEFLLAVMRTQNAEPDGIAASAAIAEQSMFEQGIVAVGDISNTAVTADLTRNSRIAYHHFIETLGVLGSAAASRLAQAIGVAERFSGPKSIVPHAPYSVSPALFDLINRVESGSLLSTHSQESVAENQLFINGSGDFEKLFAFLGVGSAQSMKTGQSALQSWLPYITSDHTMLLVHNTATDSNDIEWLKQSNTFLPQLYWCLCPNANLYINNMIPDVMLLERSGISMVVGTDSLASNETLNIIDELHTIQRRFPTLKLSQLLRWATINGAKALRMQSSLGSFEEGKIPGVILLEGALDGSLKGATSRRIL